MAANQVMDLFDSFWFEMEIFKMGQTQFQSPISGHNPSGQFQEESSKPEEDEEILIKVPTIITRSMSDQLSFKLLSPSSGSLPFSPDSVLSTPRHLQTILSGKEISDVESAETYSPSHVRLESGRKKKGKKGNRSKSLSELEIEELKGFMDLGFVFSEEDKDSSLVSIIPGLQRLGRNDNNNNNGIINGDDEKKKNREDPVINEPAISRPYLSEAWEDLDRKRRENPLANWGIPTLSNEIEIKDSLRWWAHTVASTVR